MDKLEFGRVFRSERIRKGFEKQADLINDFELKTGIKLLKSAVSMYENGQRIPETELLEKLADYFEVSMDYLLGRSSTRLDIVYKTIDNMADLFSRLSENDKDAATHYMKYLIVKEEEANYEKTKEEERRKISPDGKNL